MEVTGLVLKQGILLFWALWLTVAWLANTCDGLKACHLWLNAILFGGVILWQGCAALLFWFALSVFQGVHRPGGNALYAAFLVSLALWAAFIIIDEIFLAYATEDTHLRVFTAQALSLLLLLLVPEGG
jgi:hypothetical protein